MYRDAALRAENESLLQHLGPPTDPIASRHLDVMMLHLPHDSPDSGVDPVMMLYAIPQLTAAPQHPQSPQTPPGTCLPRSAIASRALPRSRPPPQLRYAVRSADPTIT